MKKRKRTLFVSVLFLVLTLPAVWAGVVNSLDSQHSQEKYQEPQMQFSENNCGDQLTVTAPPPVPPDPFNPKYIYYSEAGRITSAAILYAMSTAKPNTNSELDILNMLYRVFENEGVAREPCWYPSAECSTPPCHLVAAGKNTVYDHHKPTTWPLRYWELVYIDTGAGYNGACSDVTRTFPVGPIFTERQKQIYKAVLIALKEGEAGAMLKESLEQIKGEMWSAFKSYVRGHNLKALDQTGKYQYLYYFADPYGWKHFIGWGTDVHGDHTGWKGDQPLEPGMVFALEPALYIPREQVGIRIEDTFMVSASGVVMRLSAGCPREIGEIEKIRQGCQSQLPADEGQDLELGAVLSPE